MRPTYRIVNTLMEALYAKYSPCGVLELAYSETQSTYPYCCLCVLGNAGGGTYITYGEMRLEISTHPLSTADVEWSKETNEK